MKEVNERHEAEALLSILSRKDAAEFVAEALADKAETFVKLALAVHEAADVNESDRPRHIRVCAAIGRIVLDTTESYIRSCPAFESAVAAAEQDDREAAADAKYDERRDDKLTGDRT